MLFFKALAGGIAFPNQAADLIPNRKSRDNFGKGEGGVGGLTGQCGFSWPRPEGVRFPSKLPIRFPTKGQETILEKV